MMKFDEPLEKALSLSLNALTILLVLDLIVI